ncbi:MAG: hypothetical protein M1825_005551 [Sarcosagium campestre]|nr:MAG: hypothetical protein M1825_005551 [Sarcosagium campestre]
MPVKWTPDNDQVLLLKILETHPTISVDASAVANAWPADREKPTARAISERLVKIRKTAGVQLSITRAGNGTPTTSPKRKRLPTSMTPTSDKRKRGSPSGNKKGVHVKIEDAVNSPTNTAANPADDDEDEDYASARIPVNETHASLPASDDVFGGGRASIDGLSSFDIKMERDQYMPVQEPIRDHPSDLVDHTLEAAQLDGFSDLNGGDSFGRFKVEQYSEEDADLETDGDLAQFSYSSTYAYMDDHDLVV